MTNPSKPDTPYMAEQWMIQLANDLVSDPRPTRHESILGMIQRAALQAKSESRGAMTAQQFRPLWIRSEMQRLGKQLLIPGLDLELRFADALSAHNTAQLTKDRQRLADYESADLQIVELHAKELADHEKEVLELRAALEAAQKEIERTRGYDAVLAEVGKLQAIVEAGDAENGRMADELSGLRSQGAHCDHRTCIGPVACPVHISEHVGIWRWIVCELCGATKRWDYREIPTDYTSDPRLAAIEWRLPTVRSQGAGSNCLHEVPLNSHCARCFHVSLQTNQREMSPVRSQGVGQWEAVESKPKSSGEYLTFSHDGKEGWSMSQYWNGFEWRYGSHVTHWMPMPKPPAGLASPPEDKK